MGSGCMVGAIRWDAWYGDGSASGARGTQQSLSRAGQHSRAPLHTVEDSPWRLHFAPTQATMDAEILAARAGGLAYWAFLLYPRNGAAASQMLGFDLYQSSSIKAQIAWAMIRQTNDWGSTGAYGPQVAESISYVSQGHYQRVLVSRPLVYVYYTAQDIANYWGGNIANLRAALEAFRAQVQAAGLGNPYLVVLAGSNYLSVGTALGADAVSAYIAGFPARRHGTYAQLDSDTRAWWDTQRVSYGAVIPICMCGWDREPRIVRPVPWETTTQRAYLGRGIGYAQPTPAELATHFQAAVSYVQGHPVECASKAILAYAWNEHDEGGWLAPTLGDPSGVRLAAIAPIIRM